MKCTFQFLNRTYLRGTTTRKYFCSGVTPKWNWQCTRIVWNNIFCQEGHAATTNNALSLQISVFGRKYTKNSIDVQFWVFDDFSDSP